MSQKNNSNYPNRGEEALKTGRETIFVEMDLENSMVVKASRASAKRMAARLKKTVPGNWQHVQT